MRNTTNRPIVVGLDRSPQACAALEYAAELATCRRAPLRLVHGYDSSELVLRPTLGWTSDLGGTLRGTGERLVLASVEHVTRRHPRLAVQTRLEPGSPVAVLIEASREAHAVVLGSRGSGAFADLALGSTTLHLTAEAACPVISVPKPWAGVGRGVVVGVDGSESCEQAIQYAFEVAADLGTSLTALHVWRVNPASVGPASPLTTQLAEDREDARLFLAESLADWQEKFPSVPVKHRVMLGHPVSGLVRLSADAALLVVGRSGGGSEEALSLGSVSHGVLHHAGVAVAVVPR